VYVRGSEDVRGTAEDPRMLGEPWAAPTASTGGVHYHHVPPASAPGHANMPVHVLQVLGIEAARECMRTELHRIMPSIPDCHVRLLADACTADGHLRSVSGVDTQRIQRPDVLCNASFERAPGIFAAAARERTVDPIRTVSSLLAVGRVPRLGTGTVALRSTVDVPAPETSDVLDFLDMPSAKRRKFASYIQ
jgi:hypothetical protein